MHRRSARERAHLPLCGRARMASPEKIEAFLAGRQPYAYLPRLRRAGRPGRSPGTEGACWLWAGSGRARRATSFPGRCSSSSNGSPGLPLRATARTPALADLHPHQEAGTSAYVWHLFDRLDDLRPLLRPCIGPHEYAVMPHVGFLVGSGLSAVSLIFDWRAGRWPGLVAAARCWAGAVSVVMVGACGGSARRHIDCGLTSRGNRCPGGGGPAQGARGGLMEDRELVRRQVEVYVACAVGGCQDWHRAGAPV